MADVQLIYADNPGSLPASWTVPPGNEITLESIVARFDGAGASGTFNPVLSVYSQDGRLIGRFLPAQRFATGDTGVVTYAPFLGRGGGGGGGSALQIVGAKVKRPVSDPQVIPSDFDWHTVEFTELIFDTANMWDPGDASKLTIPETGVWLLSGSGGIVDTGTGGRGAALRKNDEVGLQLVQTQGPGGNEVWSGSVTITEQLEEGDFIRMLYNQSSGFNLDSGDTYLSAYFVGTED